MNLINPRKAEPAEELIDSYRHRMSTSLESFEFATIVALVREIQLVREKGRTVFIAGNGGSAATANHLALDWMLGTKLTNPPLRVISLSESVASITATGNDLSFGDVFARQLEALSEEDDLLVIISASGNSPNLISLSEVAHRNGCRIATLTGFDGGKLAKIADVSVHVPTTDGDYGVSEDLHLMIGHIVKELLISASRKP